jgi:hypothetical protein
MANRPGGLTALAVLNFVFGGIGAIAALIGYGAIAVTRGVIEKAEASGLKYEGQPLTMVKVAVALTAVGAALLIISGVGYLKQSRFAGKTLGNVYALVSIGGTVLTAATGGGIGGFGLVLLVYPLLTLILLNTSFKNAFQA